MIYFIYGNNFSKSRDKLREILESSIRKNPESSYFKIDKENWSESALEEMLQAQGLFQNKYIVILDSVFENKDSATFILDKTEDLKKSPNIFIIIENEPTKETIKKISKFAEKVQEFVDGEREVGSKDFNVFSLTDALGSKDKKRLWILYEKAKREGVDSEEIHRILFWQTRAIISALSSQDAYKAGLNPFVFKKSLNFSENFSKKELIQMSSDLLKIYHEARKGVSSLDISLERFILNL